RFDTTHDCNSRCNRIGSHGQTANRVSLNFLRTNAFEDQAGNQKCAAWIQGCHSAVEVIRALFPGRQSKVADSKRFLTDQVPKLAELIIHGPECYNFGCRSYHVFDCSYAWASRRIPDSSNAPPMNCRPSGRLEAVKPHGTETAGRPVIFPKAKLLPLTIPIGFVMGRSGISSNAAVVLAV